MAPKRALAAASKVATLEELQPFQASYVFRVMPAFSVMPVFWLTLVEHRILLLRLMLRKHGGC